MFRIKCGYHCGCYGEHDSCWPPESFPLPPPHGRPYKYLKAWWKYWKIFFKKWFLFEAMNENHRRVVCMRITLRWCDLHACDFIPTKNNGFCVYRTAFHFVNAGESLWWSPSIPEEINTHAAIHCKVTARYVYLYLRPFILLYLVMPSCPGLPERRDLVSQWVRSGRIKDKLRRNCASIWTRIYEFGRQKVPPSQNSSQEL